jgi:hypothetical protein
LPKLIVLKLDIPPLPLNGEQIIEFCESGFPDGDRLDGVCYGGIGFVVKRNNDESF